MKKFDVVLGNPPYQESNDKRNRQDALYDLFMELGYKIGKEVIFITPARFLSNAGSTSKAWSKKMLEDPHLKLLFYEAEANKVFPGSANIRGGIAVTYRNDEKEIGPIGEFIANTDMASIVQKVRDIHGKTKKNLSSLMHVQNKFDINSVICDYNEISKILGGGQPERRIVSSSFTKFPQLFTDCKSLSDDIQIFGRLANERCIKWTHAKYVEDNGNLFKYKVFVAAANGKGDFGETLSMPFVAWPGLGHTQTFISFGAFDSEYEARALCKYLLTKFARALLSLKKVTHNNKTAEVWETIPLQDFTESSDIDWTLTVPDIDRQLYKKYSLLPEEVKYIEKNVMPMYENAGECID